MLETSFCLCFYALLNISPTPWDFRVGFACMVEVMPVFSLLIFMSVLVTTLILSTATEVLNCLTFL